MHVREIVLLAVASIDMRQAVGEAGFARVAAGSRECTTDDAIACVVASGSAR